MIEPQQSLAAHMAFNLACFIYFLVIFITQIYAILANKLRTYTMEYNFFRFYMVNFHLIVL